LILIVVLFSETLSRKEAGMKLWDPRIPAVLKFAWPFAAIVFVGVIVMLYGPCESLPLNHFDKIGIATVAGILDIELWMYVLYGFGQWDGTSLRTNTKSDAEP
jgi:hypothetical protein